MIIVGAPSQLAIAENSCVDCHKKPEILSELRPWQVESYFHWRESVHGQTGVTCEKCHGGNPTHMKKQLAHQGVLDAMQPKSSIFFKKVPQMCGVCHRAVYEQYTRSRHYQKVKAAKVAPTCTTCHGRHMGIGPTTFEGLGTKCAGCHNTRTGIDPAVPRDVETILTLAAQIDETMAKIRMVIVLARDAKRDIEHVDKQFNRVKTAWDNVALLWHSFDLKQFNRQAQEILKEASQLYSRSKAILLQRK